MSKLVDNVPDFLYKPAAIDLDKLPKIKKEGLTLFYNLQKYYQSKKKFYYIVDFKKQHGNIKDSCPVLSSELERLKLLDLFYSILFVQKLSSHSVMPIHRDADHNNEFVYNHLGLNIPIMGCENSFTVFYDGVLDDPNKEQDDSTFGNESVKLGGKFIKPETAIEIDRITSDMPLWLNTYAFHAGQTFNQKPRLLMSLRFYDLSHLFNNGYFDEHLVAK
jgi:hypothetical protein